MRNRLETSEGASILPAVERYLRLCPLAAVGDQLLGVDLPRRARVSD